MAYCNIQGHIFLFAGDTSHGIPEDWPCICGGVTYNRAAEQRVQPTKADVEKRKSFAGWPKITDNELDAKDNPL